MKSKTWFVFALLKLGELALLAAVSFSCYFIGGLIGNDPLWNPLWMRMFCGFFILLMGLGILGVAYCLICFIIEVNIKWAKKITGESKSGEKEDDKKKS